MDSNARYREQIYRTAELFIKHKLPTYVNDNQRLLDCTEAHLKERLFAPEFLARRAVKRAAAEFFLACFDGLPHTGSSVRASIPAHVSGCSNKNLGSEKRKPQAGRPGVFLKLFSAKKQENDTKVSSLASVTSSGNPQLMTGCKMLNGIDRSAPSAWTAVTRIGERHASH